MSTEITTAFAAKFHDDFIMLSQQREARLWTPTTLRTEPDKLAGKYGYYDRIGATSMQQKTGRHADTPLMNTPHSRRRITLTDWNWADLIDTSDLARMMKNPQNRYVQNAVMAANRKKDDRFVAAAIGNSYSIDEDDAASTIALPSGQKIPVSTTGLTLAKLLTAKEILDSNEAGEDEPRFIACTAKQITNLLNTTEVKSADYNSVKALVEGRIDTFLGYKFIRTERLTNTSTTRHCIAWLQSGMGGAIGEEVMVDVGVRRDKNLSTQVYVEMSLDATRIEDEKVVQIDCLES